MIHVIFGAGVLVVAYVAYKYGKSGVVSAVEAEFAKVKSGVSADVDKLVAAIKAKF